MRVSFLRRVIARNIVFAIAFMAALGAGPASAASRAAARGLPRLLFISSYSPDFHSYPLQREGLVAGLLANGFPDGSYVLDTEFLDSKRFPYAERARRLRNDLAYKLKTLKRFDLIVVADDNALRFALDNMDVLFAGAPVVFLGVNDIRLALAQNENPRVTGVVERQSYAETLALAARLFPAAAHIHVTLGGTTTGSVNNGLVRKAFERIPGPAPQWHDLSQLTYDAFFAAMARAPAGEPLLLNAIYRDAGGATLDFMEFMTQLRAVYRGPVFAVQGHAIGEGALGGKVVSHRRQGLAAAGLAARILRGTSPADLPVVADSPNVYMFDDLELRRFSIPSQRLPADALIRNRPRSIFVDYGGWVAGGLAALLLQAGLIVVLLRNRHHRRLAEAAMRESEARLHAFFDHSSEIMYVKDCTHRIVAANRRYLEFYATTEAEAYGQRTVAHMSSETRAQLEAHDDSVLASGAPITQTIEIAAPDGEVRHFMIAKFPIFGACGKPVAIGAINSDITEMKQQKARLEEAKEKAETAAAAAHAASRTKSEFLANMSHEIRTPMNGVLGAVSILATTPLTERQQEHVETIRESGTALLGLLNDILDLSKIEAGRMDLDATDFSLPALLRGTAALWEPAAREKGLSFRLTGPIDGAGVVRCDSTRLRQVLNNLIGNAVKFTAEGGIEVAVAEAVRPDGRLELRFEVRDSGIGIDAAAQTRLFRPFTQADESTTRKFGGTGLGLSICRRLVDMAGGEISLESAPGQGSVFRFSMIAERGNPDRVAPEAGPLSDLPPAALPADRKLRVLLAEDNGTNRKVAAWMLEPLGCQLDQVANGLDAVAAVARSSYDIVLMDVQMPEMDGVAATARIRALPAPACDVPIVALTANAMRGDRERYLAAGMSDYVVKPIDRRDLFAAIGRCLDMAIPAPPPAGPVVPPAAMPAEGLPDGADDLLDHLDRLMQSAAG